MSHKETVCPVCCLPTTNPDGMHRSCYLKDRRGFMDDETARRKKRSLDRYVRRKGTDEGRAPDGLRYRVKVMCVETGEVFESMTSAAKAMGIDNRYISAVVNGKCKSTHGYHWKKVTE